tara:strand:+ start:160 stop:297 length:138 start_codon:yes stop_codon:yes gene_type:complete
MTKILIRLEFERQTIAASDILEYITELMQDGTLDFEIVKNKESDQ